MFFERVAIFTLQLRAKLAAFSKYMLRETNSQFVHLVLTCIFSFATMVLLYVWIIHFPLWLQLGYSAIYILIGILCATIFYFHITNKKIRINPDGMEVVTSEKYESRKFQQLNLKAIPLTPLQKKHIFDAFYLNYLKGSYQSFQCLVLLNPISEKDRLKWKDASPKRPKQVNRQTLLEFLSQLMIGFENLENQQIMEFVNYYFVLQNSEGASQHLSSKNISDWRMNKASYLKEISRIFQQHL
ncbi:hypothetical protein RM553_15315 [Zunongwangia sp. F363]|uniref:Uncharacterized protein n=1 Tax=Autumnicola tepida TaxID=3075595 RepID=A0ABU3CCZ4_9FLAO|nr:hypothetical protein [Zunongwangia sp. F363]MDT0644205.1 hypothetical protein [Zunongwangia sp. F363]